jgi:hypothetical protein
VRYLWVSFSGWNLQHLSSYDFETKSLNLWVYPPLSVSSAKELKEHWNMETWWPSLNAWILMTCSMLMMFGCSPLSECCMGKWLLYQPCCVLWSMLWILASECLLGLSMRFFITPRLVIYYICMYTSTLSSIYLLSCDLISSLPIFNTWEHFVCECGQFFSSWWLVKYLSSCWMLREDPSSNLIHSNKTPKGHHPTRQQVTKQLRR